MLNQQFDLYFQNYKDVCHVVQVSTSDYCDTRYINTLKVVSIPISYCDTAMHHPISTGYNLLVSFRALQDRMIHYNYIKKQYMISMRGYFHSNRYCRGLAKVMMQLCCLTDHDDYKCFLNSYKVKHNRTDCGF